MLIGFSGRDVAATRFALSPLGEAISSYVALRFPEKHALVLPWAREAKARAAGVDMELLDRLLVRPFASGHKRYADFLVPYPQHAGTTIEEELAELAATPAAEVVADVAANYAGLDAGPFAPFLDAPEATMRTLAGQLDAYWGAAIAPQWPRIRLILENDVMYRAHLLAERGLGALFASLGEKHAFDGATLQVGGMCEGSWTLTGEGIVLVPSVFTTHGAVSTKPGRQVLRYGARGSALAFQAVPFDPDVALVALLGKPRATLLVRLETPATTSDLAAQLGVTPAAISQQLGWLKQAGLVVTRKVGPRSWHTLTVVGQGLLDVYDPPNGARRAAPPRDAPGRRGALRGQDANVRA